LVPRYIVDAMIEKQGGWDLEIPGMEDWDYQIGVHVLGYCAYHIPEPLFVYRMFTSTKREVDYAKIDLIRAYMDTKWQAYRTGEVKLMCGCKQPNRPNSSVPASTLTSSGNFARQSVALVADTNDKTQMVTLEYVGPVVGPFTIKSRVSRDVSYRFGNSEFHKTRSVFLGDAEWLINMKDATGSPTYIVLSGTGAQGANDPSAFVGQAITA